LNYEKLENYIEAMEIVKTTSPISSQVIKYGERNPYFEWSEFSQGREGCSFNVKVDVYCTFIVLTVIDCSDCQQICWNGVFYQNSILVLEPGNYTVTVFGPNCQSSSNLNITKVGIILDPSISSPSTLCSGGNAVLTANLNETVTNYKWSTNANTQSININSPGVYSVTVTNASGCTGVAQANVLPGNKPGKPSITMSEEGEGVRFTSTLGSGYFWSNNGATTQSVLITTNGLHNLSVAIKDASGCISDFSDTKSLYIKKTVIHDTVSLLSCPLSAGFSYEIDEVNLKKVYFKDLSTGEPEVYIWNFGDGGTGLFGQERNPMHLYEKDGWYIVTLTVVKDGEVKSFSNHVFINSKTGDGNSGGVSTLECDTTKIKGSFGTHGETIKYGQTVVLAEKPDPLSGPELRLIAPIVTADDNEILKYSWSAGAFAGGNNIQAALTQGWHFYRLTVNSTKNGITKPKQCFEFEYGVKIGSGLTTDTDDAENRSREDKDNINVYPNPASESVNIDISNAPIGPLFINISDSQGRSVTKKVIKQ
jgi:hypothetical protein